MRCETVTLDNDVVINKSDYDPKIHKLKGEKVAPKPKPKKKK